MKDINGENSQQLRSFYRTGIALCAPPAVLTTDIESLEGITTITVSEVGTEIVKTIMACT